MADANHGESSEAAKPAEEASELPALEPSGSPRHEVAERDPSFLATRSMPAVPPFIAKSDKMRHSQSDSRLLPKPNSLLSKMRQSLTMSAAMFRKNGADGADMAQSSQRAGPSGFTAEVVSAAVGIRPSFYWNKAVLSEEERMLAVLSAKSLKSDSQDEVCLTPNFAGKEGCTFIGVFDGHGPEGRAAAKYAGRYVQHVLRKDKRIFAADTKKKYVALKNACYSCQKKMGDYRQSGFDAYFSGTTAVFGVLMDGTIHIANCGDSRAVIGRCNRDGGVEAVPLTEDAKPENPIESKRIYRRGGVVSQMSDGHGNRIGPHRVYKRGTEYPGLAMSRSLGDMTAHSVGVIAKPERSSYSIVPEDEFMIFGSDGVWQVLSDQEAVEFVHMYMNARDDTHNCADALTLHAQDMWKKQMDEVIVDDIGVVILHFKPLPPVRVKRALHHSNTAAQTNDQANQMYRKWERSPHLDPGLVVDKMHFRYLQNDQVKTLMSRLSESDAARQPADPSWSSTVRSQQGSATGQSSPWGTDRGLLFLPDSHPRDGERSGKSLSRTEPSMATEQDGPVEVLMDASGKPKLADARRNSLPKSVASSQAGPGSLGKLAAISGEVIVPGKATSFDSERMVKTLNTGVVSSVRMLAKSMTGRSVKKSLDGGSSEVSREHSPKGAMDSSQERRKKPGAHAAAAAPPSHLGQDAPNVTPQKGESNAEVDMFAPHDVNSWLIACKEGLFMSPNAVVTERPVADGEEASSLGGAGGGAGKQNPTRFWPKGTPGAPPQPSAEGTVETQEAPQRRLTSNLLLMHNDAFRQMDSKRAAHT